MGALVAFELARSAQRMGRVAAHLFVSACAAPQLPRRRVRFLYDLPDRVLQQELMRSSSFPSRAINRPELMELMLPIFRADIRLCETYKYSRGPLLRCPLTAYGGIADPSVTYQELAAWSVHSTESFKANLLPGGHQYLNDHIPPVVGDVCQQLLHIAA
jgi:surfactin synthase thioesterase subunit